MISGGLEAQLVVGQEHPLDPTERHVLPNISKIGESFCPYYFLSTYLRGLASGD